MSSNTYRKGSSESNDILKKIEATQGEEISLPGTSTRDLIKFTFLEVLVREAVQRYGVLGQVKMKRQMVKHLIGEMKDLCEIADEVLDS